MSGVGSLLGGVGKSLLRGGSASFEDASLDAQLLAIDQKAKVKIKKMVPQKYEVRGGAGLSWGPSSPALRAPLILPGVPARTDIDRRAANAAAH